MPTELVLLGLDLAWKPDRHPSALAVWDASRQQAQLHAALPSAQAVREAVGNAATDAALLAVDAPLIVRNPKGQRPCESQLNADFRRHHAGAHPSNLNLYPKAETARLADHWRQHGFRDFPAQGVYNASPQRWMAEVYPHPAQITLLGREQIVRYKRGSVEERRARLAQYQELLRDHLAIQLPGFLAAPEIDGLFAESPQLLRGRALKSHEDALDACFCVAIAARLACARAADFYYYGDHDTGFIVVPRA